MVAKLICTGFSQDQHGSWEFVTDGANCKGFDGEIGTEERGNPGWIPSVTNGREVEISSLDAELRQGFSTLRSDSRRSTESSLVGYQSSTGI